MVGVDITSLNLPEIAVKLELENGTNEETRQHNLQKLLRHGYSVHQANFIAEWRANNASFDIATSASREARGVNDNPFVGLGEQALSELAYAGRANASGNPAEPRQLRNVHRADRMSFDPNAPAFEGGAAGVVASSPHLPGSSEAPFVNELAPKRTGYRGGYGPTHDYSSPNNNGMGFINPPPEMQERLLTVEELSNTGEFDATETGERSKDDLVEYQGTESIGATTETSGSDSYGQSGQG